MTDIEIVEAIKVILVDEYQDIDFISGFYEDVKKVPAAMVEMIGSAPTENNSELIGNPIIRIDLFDVNSKDANLKYRSNQSISELNKRMYSILNQLRTRFKINFSVSNLENETLKINAQGGGHCVLSSTTITIK